MAIFKKKAWPELFKEVLAGKKKFDLRLNDFEIQEGDTLVLEEWNPLTKQYTGRKIEKKVGYILKLPPEKLFAMWNENEIKEKGIQVISLE